MAKVKVFRYVGQMSRSLGLSERPHHKEWACDIRKPLYDTSSDLKFMVKVKVLLEISSKVTVKVTDRGIIWKGYII